MKPTRPRGRPRVDDEDESVRVKVTMPAYQYDYLYAASKRSEVSVPEVIRRHLPKVKRAK